MLYWEAGAWCQGEHGAGSVPCIIYPKNAQQVAVRGSTHIRAPCSMQSALRFIAGRCPNRLLQQMFKASWHTAQAPLATGRNHLQQVPPVME